MSNTNAGAAQSSAPMPQPGGQQDNNETIIDLRMLFGMLGAHKFFISIIIIICLLIGGLYAFSLKPQYQSTALIEVQGSSENASNLLAMLNVGGNADAIKGFNRSASPAEIETALIESEYIMADVIQQLKLDILVTPNYLPVIGKVYAKLTTHSVSHDSFMTRLLPSYSWGGDHLSISNLTVPSYLEGMRFKLIVGEQANAYSVYTQDGEKILTGRAGELATSDNSDYPISLLVGQLNARPGVSFTVVKRSTKEAMASVISHLSIAEKGDLTGILQLGYQSINPRSSQKILNAIINTAVAKNVATKAEEAGKTLDFLKKQLPTVTKDLNKAQSDLNNYRSESGNIDADMEAQILLQQVTALQKEIEDLKLKRLQLLQNFTKKHPYILALDQQIKVVEQKAAALEKRLRALPKASQQASNYQRDISVQGNIYTNVIQNMQQMEMLKASTVSAVRILSLASFPVEPLKSKTAVILLISGIIGIFIAFAILLLRQALVRTIQDPLVVEKALGLSTMAIVPFSRHQANLIKIIQEDKSANRSRSRLLADYRPKDVTIESLRGLRTSLKLALLAAERQVISISGCSPGIGKSFVSSNLVKLFAELDQKVLLIDADMRKGHAFQALGGQRSPGLSEYLKEEVSREQAIQKLVPNIDLLATGRYPSNPTELLIKDKFHRLLTDVADDYDLVIIDTPPILAVTDAALVLKYTDVNLLVIGSGRDQLAEVQHAKAMLEKSGVQLTGVVYNNLNQHIRKYGYGNYYNYNYSYE